MTFWVQCAVSPIFAGIFYNPMGFLIPVQYSLTHLVCLLAQLLRCRKQTQSSDRMGKEFFFFTFKAFVSGLKREKWWWRFANHIDSLPPPITVFASA